MDISQRGIDLIVSFEGKHKKLKDGRYQAYLDTLAKPAVWTLYCGLTRGITEGMICSEEEGQRMFRKELNIYEDAIERLVKVPLNENQFSALVSFTYNCGVGALEKSTLLKLLNQGKYEAVPSQMMRWVNAGGKRYEGLARRRAAEGALFAEPIPAAEASPGGDEAPAMPQRVDPGPVMTATEAFKSSPTTQLTAGSIVLMLYNWGQSAVDFALGVVKEAGPQIVETQKDLSPFSAIMSTTGGIAVAIAIGCLVAASVRQIIKRREGTSV
jgi:lysozyme